MQNSGSCREVDSVQVGARPNLPRRRRPGLTRRAQPGRTRSSLTPRYPGSVVRQRTTRSLPILRSRLAHALARLEWYPQKPLKNAGETLHSARLPFLLPFPACACGNGYVKTRPDLGLELLLPKDGSEPACVIEHRIH